MKQTKRIYQPEPRQVGRKLLVQVVPFVLMLAISSWLTLWAGQQIEQHRNQRMSTDKLIELQHF